MIAGALAGMLAAAPAAAEDCWPYTEAQALTQRYGLETVTARGARAARFVRLKNASGIPLTRGHPDFVAVAFVPFRGVAYVGFGYGHLLCDKLVLPIDTARKFLIHPKSKRRA